MTSTQLTCASSSMDTPPSAQDQVVGGLDGDSTFQPAGDLTRPNARCSPGPQADPETIFDDRRIYTRKRWGAIQASDRRCWLSITTRGSDRKAPRVLRMANSTRKSLTRAPSFSRTNSLSNTLRTTSLGS